jgi:short-subunit dehydrogenase
MSSLLITGSSTGIGHASCEFFADKGWTVFAGSRDPKKLSFTNPSIIPVEIDVNDPASIKKCFYRDDIKAIDCVINNAGYGLLLPFEDTPPKEIEKMYRTNVFGLMEVCRHAALLFRGKREGTILNIASAIGRIGTPFYTVYSSTKWAVEGFSESLAHELRPFNVHVKIVEPAGTHTEFHTRAYDTSDIPISNDYKKRYEEKHATRMKNVHSQYDPPAKIAALMYDAVTDGTWRLRYGVAAVEEVEELRRKIGNEALWQRMSERMGSM